MQRLAVTAAVLAIAACAGGDSNTDDTKARGFIAKPDSPIVYMADTTPNIVGPNDSLRRAERRAAFARLPKPTPQMAEAARQEFARQDSLASIAWYQSRPRSPVRFDVVDNARPRASARSWTPTDVHADRKPPYACARFVGGLKHRQVGDTLLYVLVIDNRARAYPNEWCVPWGVTVVTVDTALRMLVTYPSSPRACDPWPASIPLEPACKRKAS